MDSPLQVIPFEPWAIMNPAAGFYKFLFRGEYTEETLNKAAAYIKSWARETGNWTVTRSKERHIPQQMMFEVKAWLR